MNKKNSFFTIISIAFLITGNLVGAGILGLPVNTGISGFFPSLLGMFVFGGAMFYSALVLSRIISKERQTDFNYPSFYQKSLGKTGKWLAILANMLILYGLLTAYLTGGVTIIVKLFNIPKASLLVLLLFFLLLTGMAILGIKIIKKYNILLMLLLWLSFVVIVFIGETHVEPIRLKHTDWGLLPVAVPIIITSFHFHNIIPNICNSLKWDFKSISIAILIGMLIGYLMNALWIQVGLGCLPLDSGNDSLMYAFQHNIPATVPMGQIIHSKTFIIISMLFALLAIITSFVTNSMGLLGFNTDLISHFIKRKNKGLVFVLTFVPPLLISFFFPDIFLKALNIVGGIGIVLLFGILPCIFSMVNSGKNKKSLIIAIFFLILFVSVFLFQISEEMGFTEKIPKAKHVKSNVEKNR